MNYSETKNITAKKQHGCQYCGETILINEVYRKWTAFDCGDIYVNKMHTECYEYLSSEGWPEYYLFDGERPSNLSNIQRQRMELLQG
jgi:hypothetical protein